MVSYAKCAMRKPVPRNTNVMARGTCRMMPIRHLFPVLLLFACVFALTAHSAASAAPPAPDAKPVPKIARLASALGDARTGLDFTLHRLGPGGGPVLLVVGGIQGDEPGGFSAASLLVTSYTITSGQVWVVPNLNFPSIIERNRGAGGDMNRKFAHVDAKDPDYSAVRRIQDIIRDPGVGVILNLHDGSGFYRPTWENAMRNPKRWGQCVIIDQENIDAPSFGQLGKMARIAVQDANKRLLKPEHCYHLKNTETRKGDVEMEKTLTYFAINSGKPAFGVEASKDFTTEYRSYYHIQVLESFMRQMGIAFKRNFPLTPKGVQTAINSDLGIALYDDRLVLPLDNARPSLGYVPLKKDAAVAAKYTKPLLAVLKDKDSWKIAYGNRTLTRLTPQYMDYDDSLTRLEIVRDGKNVAVPIGEVVAVDGSFSIKSMPGYRVNAIGATKEKEDGSECGIVLRKQDFMPRFSVDKGGTTFRVEIYKGDAFAGMILVRFGKALPASRETMTATGGPESKFGY